MFLALYGLGTSCTREEVYPEPDEELTAAYITDSVHYQTMGMTAYNFVYPSKDPLNKPTMLSGTITISDKLSRQEKAPGLILYNHYTIYRADQCPSRGNLNLQKLLGEGKLITISADYYGFGETEEAHQAYCISRANAQSSVDALLAAEELLDSMGFSWGDYLFNIGYSQGAQTAIGVVRLVDQEYPGINISYTLVGAGPYDIPEIYRQFLNSSIAGMPSTVISVLLSYNEFHQLNVPYDQMFVEPVLSHIDEWFYSKKYTRVEIDEMVGSQAIEDYIAPTMMDTTTENSQRLLAVMNEDNLCKDWTPRSSDRFFLFHNTKDITVPVASTTKLYQFLISQGLNNVVLDTADYGESTFLPAHEIGTAPFLIQSIGMMSNLMGITPWVN